MTLTKQVKDYYSILGVNPNASHAQIQEAYHRLAVQHHPKKTRQETLQAHKKFKDVCEAYHVLGNKDKRSHYDHFIKNEFSLQQAEKIFNKFYQEFGVQNEEEKDFFQENYPHTTKDYYHVLGIQRHSSIDQIQNAYRKLALKYHPRRNPDDEQAKRKFVEVNEAYNALSCQNKRNSYNQITFKTLEPSRAVEVFQQFFSDKFFKTPQEQEFFRPMIQTKWINSLDRIMNSIHHQPNHENSQIRRVHQVYQNKNGVQCRKVVNQHKKMRDGKVHAQTTEQYTLPNGDKEIRKTIKEGDKVEKKVHYIKKGEQIRQISQHHSEPIQLEKASQNQGEKILNQEQNAQISSSKEMRNGSNRLQNENATPCASNHENTHVSKQTETGHQTEVENAN